MTRLFPIRMLISSVSLIEADNNINQSFSVSEVQGVHRMVTLNILGERSGHGRNGRGERHIWRCGRPRSLGGCRLVGQYHASRRCYQHCATDVAYTSTVSTGVYFDNFVVFNCNALV